MTAVTPGSAELLACPFCKATSIGIEHDGSIFAGQTYPGHSRSDGWKARCDGCGNQTAWWHSEADARRAWNTRLAAKPAEEGVPDKIIGDIEKRFPNWKSYRDLVDCIDCTLHFLRRGQT